MQNMEMCINTKLKLTFCQFKRKAQRIMSKYLDQRSDKVDKKCTKPKLCKEPSNNIYILFLFRHEVKNRTSFIPVLILITVMVLFLLSRIST